LAFILLQLIKNRYHFISTLDFFNYTAHLARRTFYKYDCSLLWTRLLPEWSHGAKDFIK